MILLMDAEPALLAAVLAGWVSGFAVALASTGYLMFGLSRARIRPLPNLRVSLPLFGIVAINALVISWTLAGIVAGVVYHLAGPSRFIAGTIAVHVLAALVYAIARGHPGSGEARVVWVTLLTSAGTFIGVLPFLAAQG